MGYIYCITFPNSKMYIGQTKRSVEKRIKEHYVQDNCRLISNAIQKYGKQHISVETLLEVNDKDLDIYEKKFISLLSTQYPNGYNLTDGCGNNIIYSEESRNKMSENKKGSKNYNFGKERTIETKKKISEQKSGEKHHFYNKSFSLEHKLNLSKSHKQEDDNLPMYMVKVKERPENYTSEGFAIINYPNLKCKYFTSKKLSLQEKYVLAYNYLYSMDAVQRLNGSGSDSQQNEMKA